MKNPIKKTTEYIFLEGPSGRWMEFINVIKIASEFIGGFRHLHFIGPSITVFGSARFKEGELYYEKARLFGQEIARKGFTVVTGGGPGIMEAANRGAKEVNGRSVGCNIILPQEQRPNRFLDVMIDIKHFYVRKVLLLKYSFAFVVMPGGFGTMDEFFETLTLMQTGKIAMFPIVLFGKQYWTDLLNQTVKMKLVGTVLPRDLEMFIVTDSVEEGMQYITRVLKEKYGEQISEKASTKWWLFENFPRKLKWNRMYKIKLNGNEKVNVK